jgi:hypothetical protein
LEKVGISPLKSPRSCIEFIDCAIYPRIYKLLIRADFDGKGRNKNTAESTLFSNERHYTFPTFSTRPRITVTYTTLSDVWRS